jgi:hypothetical protein
MDWIHLAQGRGSVGVYCEHGNGLSGYTTFLGNS